MSERHEGDRERGLLRDVTIIVLLGLGLGLAFNQLGLSSRPARGLSWVGVDAVAEMPKLEDLVAEEPAPPPSGGGYKQITDPMAVGVDVASADVPSIPDLDRPIQIQLDAVKRLHDAGAAVFIDAREPHEFAEGHIPGALSMPYDEVTSQPEVLEQLDARGLPIVTYCGGGACELSLSLAWDLIYAGKSRVTVYMGGYPEWTEAGYAVDSGS